VFPSHLQGSSRNLAQGSMGMMPHGGMIGGIQRTKHDHHRHHVVLDVVVVVILRSRSQAWAA
jgi:hypothetical protein